MSNLKNKCHALLKRHKNNNGTIIEILAEKKAPIYDKKSKTKKTVITNNNK